MGGEGLSGLGEVPRLRPPGRGIARLPLPQNVACGFCVLASRLACRDDRDMPLVPRQDGRENASDLGATSSYILKISTSCLRQIGTTANLRMPHMRQLPSCRDSSLRER